MGLFKDIIADTRRFMGTNSCISGFAKASRMNYPTGDWPTVPNPKAPLEPTGRSRSMYTGWREGQTDNRSLILDTEQKKQPGVAPPSPGLPENNQPGGLKGQPGSVLIANELHKSHAWQSAPLEEILPADLLAGATPASTSSPGNTSDSSPPKQNLTKLDSVTAPDSVTAGFQAIDLQAAQEVKTDSGPLAITPASDTNENNPPPTETVKLQTSLRQSSNPSQESRQTVLSTGQEVSPASHANDRQANNSQANSPDITARHSATQVNQTTGHKVIRQPGGFRPMEGSKERTESSADIPQSAYRNKSAQGSSLSAQGSSSIGSHQVQETAFSRSSFGTNCEIPSMHIPGVIMHQPEPAAPQVHIGQIDVVVEAPVPAKDQSPRPHRSVNFASRLYLRGL